MEGHLSSGISRRTAGLFKKVVGEFDRQPLSPVHPTPVVDFEDMNEIGAFIEFVEYSVVTDAELPKTR
jgi:hypothetical protein